MKIARVVPALLLAVLAAPALAQYTLTVVPSQPRYMEPVYARITPPAMSYACLYGAQVTMAGGAITVRPRVLPELCSYSYDVLLGRFPAGSYSVTLALSGAMPGPPVAFSVGAPQETSAYPGHVPTLQVSGLWWNPSEPGWGIAIDQGPTNELFAAWFVYDVQGSPTWYTLQPGAWTSANVYQSYTGPIYRTSGPYFRGNTPPLAVTLAGEGTLSFRDATHGTLNFVIDGVRTIKEIVKQPIE